jgi:hypothetical protein
LYQFIPLVIAEGDANRARRVEVACYIIAETDVDITVIIKVVV